MDPVAFSIGALEIRWYSILLVAAFVIGYLIARSIAKEKGVKKELIDDLLVYLILGTIIGARLFEILFYNPGYYFSNPMKMVYLWEGGLASHGAIVGMIVACLAFSKKREISFYKLADIVVVPCALGAALVRIGNFINGELVGKITSSSLGVRLEGYEGLRHPVQLYQATANFVLFGIVYFMRKMKEGVVFWSFLLIYSVFRFFTEFYKDLPSDYGILNYELNTAQWLSLGIIIIAGIFLYLRCKNGMQKRK